MKIAFDGRPMQGRYTGIGRYLDNLFENLAKIDSQNQYFIFYNKEKGFSPRSFGKNFHNIQIPYYKIILEQFWLPLVCKRYHIELYLGTNHILPIIKNTKQIVVIYDLTYKYFPETHPKKVLYYYQTFIPGSLGRADQIISISKNTKEDIIKFFNINPQKIKVIYLGADLEKFQEKISKSVFNKLKHDLDIKGEYLLTVGIFEHRKNYKRLVKVFSEISKEFPALQLVMVGPKSKDFVNIKNLVSRYKIKSKVTFPGYIEDEEVVSLYQNAKLLIFPSLYEGFGIPPLEAMASGTPVISSNNSSIPEVVGDAALQFDPFDENDMKKTISYALNNPQVLDNLKKKGIKRAGLEKFSWPKVAQEILQVFKNING